MTPWEIRINNQHYSQQSVHLEEGGMGIAIPDSATGRDPHLIVTTGRRRGRQSVLRLSESPGGDIDSRIMQQVQFDEIEEGEKPNINTYRAFWGVTEVEYTP